MTSIDLNAAPVLLSFLSPDQTRDIHQATLDLLNTTGCRICHPPTLDRLREMGARIQGTDHVFLPPDLIHGALETAPSSLTLYDRRAKPAMELERGRVYYGTGSDCQYLLDLTTGQPRDFNFGEMKDAVRLAQALENIDFLMAMGLAPNLSPATAFQEKLKALLTLSAKPLVLISPPDMEILDQMVQMLTLAAGGEAQLRQRPQALFLVDPTSPLVHTQEAVEKLIFTGKRGLPVIYAPGIMAGATSPVTVAGALVQANAEILSGLVIHQAFSPGAPFVHGGGMSPMDMKSSQPTYSAPEAMTAQAGLTQMGRDHYCLPTWGFGGCSAAKICDAQAVNEAATYNQMAAWMGTNLVHDQGYMEFGLSYSFELLVLCNEFIGQTRRTMAGISTAPDQMAMDTIHQVGPGGNFLTHAHTLAHFRKNWMPDLTDRNSRSQWEKKGGTTMEDRAKERIRNILVRPEQLFLSKSCCDEMDRIIARAGS